MDLGKSVEDGWRVASETKLPLLNMALYTSLVAAVGVVAGVFVLAGGTQSVAAIILAAFLAIIFLFAFVALAVCVNAAIIKSASFFLKKRKLSIRQAWDYAVGRLLSLAALVLVVTIISSIVTYPASRIGDEMLSLAANIMLGLVIALPFLFSTCFLVVTDKKVVESLKGSVELFLKEPTQVFTALLAAMLVKTAVTLVAALPLIAVFFLLGNGGITTLLLAGIPAGLIALYGFSFASVVEDAFMVSVFTSLTAGRK